MYKRLKQKVSGIGREYDIKLSSVDGYIILKLQSIANTEDDFFQERVIFTAKEAKEFCDKMMTLANFLTGESQPNQSDSAKQE